VIQVTNWLLSVDTIFCFPMYNASVCTMSYFRFSLCISQCRGLRHLDAAGRTWTLHFCVIFLSEWFVQIRIFLLTREQLLEGDVFFFPRVPVSYDILTSTCSWFLLHEWVEECCVRYRNK
jgi:hypothetical protein